MQSGERRFLSRNREFGEDRHQPTLLPGCLADYVGEDNPARVIDVFVDELDLGNLGFEVTPAATGRPAYHSGTLLKLYIYGYSNRLKLISRVRRLTESAVKPRLSRAKAGLPPPGAVLWT
jgi:transposase